MGGESLHAGIEMKLPAAGFPRPVGHPIQQRPAKAPRAVMFIRDEIVHIAKAAPGQILAEAIASRSPDAGITFEEGETIADRLLPPDAGDEFRFHQMRTELGHHRKTGSDVRVRFGEGDLKVRGHEYFGAGEKSFTQRLRDAKSCDRMSIHLPGERVTPFNFFALMPAQRIAGPADQDVRMRFSSNPQAARLEFPRRTALALVGGGRFRISSADTCRTSPPSRLNWSPNTA